MAKQTIITARLNALDFFRFWLLSTVRDFDIYYNEHKASNLGERLAKACRRFRPAHLDFNQKTKDGLGLLYIAQENINSMLAEILKPAQALPDWLKTSLLWEARGILEYEIIFIESARYRVEELGLENIVLYGLCTPFFRQTQRFYALKGIQLKALPRFPVALKILVTPFVRFCLKRSSVKAASWRPAIWVEYSTPGIIEQAFWRKYVKKGDFEIFYYLDRADTLANSDVTRTLDKDGVDWIDMHAPQLLGTSGLGAIDLLGIFCDSFRTPGLTWALKAMIFKYQVWHAAYIRVFLKHKVKIVIQHQDRSWTQAMQASAIEKAGGIMLGYHCSNLQYCMKDWFITAQHVYFVWGKTNFEAIVRKGNSCRHILPSGLWIEESAVTDAVREFAAYSGFKLAVFDSDVSYTLYQSPKTLSDFFKAFIGLLEKHPDWKALFKFKTDDVSYLRELPDGEMLMEKITAFIQKKRILVADPHMSPITAGKSADLSLCYALNSAGICVQIRGGHAVHWDPVGMRYPLTSEEGQKIIFSTLDETMQAVEQFAAGDKRIGDLSPWRALFDYFQDTKAGERIAGFIQDYMSAVIAEPGTGGLAISDRIAEKYMEQNGITKEFYKNFSFWV